MGSGGTNNSACLCLHAEKISVLEFKVASSGLKRMKNFSLVQRAHFPVTGLKVGTFVFRNFQVTFGWWPLASSARKWVERVVLLRGEGYFMLFLCLLYLCLKSFASPMYFLIFLPPSDDTVA